ncbi:hypothetical protein BTO09_07530 [Gilvibacter sp. SZ-19]|nr:hypothetical protein BTO09_07530 [Gilvibacter sp. SZ-19]
MGISCFLLYLACGPDNSQREVPIKPQLTRQTDKIFALDNETSFEYLQPNLTELNDSLYFTFFNRKNHSIYAYHYDSGVLVHKIVLDQEGPNQLPLRYGHLSYFVQNWDSIFATNLDAYFIIDKFGVVKDKTELTSQSGFFKRKTFHLDQATQLRGDQLDCGFSQVLPDQQKPNFKRVVYDIKSKEVVKVYMDERELVSGYDEILAHNTVTAENGGIRNMGFYIVRDGDLLYTSYEIGDSIYHFRKDEKIASYYAGYSDLEVSTIQQYFDNTLVKTFEGGISIGPNPDQSPTYLTMAIDPNGRYIYRLFKHGSRRIIDAETEKETAELIGLSLVVLDLETEAVFSYKLPHEQIQIWDNFFVTEEGLHFPVLEQEEEDEKRYMVFKLL